MAVTGIAQAFREDALAAVLPGAVNRYVALLTKLPGDLTGAGLVEVSGTWYARQLNTTWIQATQADLPLTERRVNNASVKFPAATAQVQNVVGWAIYDALTVGNLVAFGELIDANNVPTLLTIKVGQEIEFPVGELQVG